MWFGFILILLPLPLPLPLPPLCPCSCQLPTAPGATFTEDAAGHVTEECDCDERDVVSSVTYSTGTGRGPKGIQGSTYMY